MYQALSSLNAHSLTRGQRILIHTEPAIGGTPGQIIPTLGVRGQDDQVDRVTGIRVTGQRMRVFLASGWMIYCGINDNAAVVL